MNHAINTMERAIKLIGDNRHRVKFNRNVSDKLIELAEKKLNVLFPSSYRLFLQKLGYGYAYGQEFYGLIAENSGFPDLVWLTLEERKNGANNSYVYVSDTGDGGSYVIDTSTETFPNEYPVLIIEVNGYVEEVSSSFGEFFYEMIKSLMGDD